MYKVYNKETKETKTVAPRELATIFSPAILQRIYDAVDAGESWETETFTIEEV